MSYFNQTGIVMTRDTALLPPLDEDDKFFLYISVRFLAKSMTISSTSWAYLLISAGAVLFVTT